MKKLRLLSFALLSSLLFTGCQKEEGYSYHQGTSESVAPILSLSTNEYELELGETWQIAYKLLNAEGKPSFQSSKPEVASVDANGLVTAKGIGEAYITVRFQNKIQSLSITVSSNKQYYIYLEMDEIILTTNGKYDLAPVLKRGNLEVVNDALFTYTCLDETIASIENNSRIKGISSGETTLLIKSSYGGENFYKTVGVKVNADMYIDTALEYNLTFTNGSVIDFPDIKIRKISDNSIISGKDINIISNSPSLIEVDNTNKKLILHDSGKTILNVTCESMVKEVNTSLVHGDPQKDEYRLFLTKDDGKGILADVYNNKSAVNQPDAPVLFYNTSLGNDHLNEYVIKTGSNIGVENKAVKYIGLYFDPIQSKEHLQSLYNEGYRYISFDYLKEAQTVGDTWRMYYFSHLYRDGQEVINRGASDLNTWINFQIPLSKILESSFYEDMKESKGATRIPLITIDTEDRSTTYNLYFTGFKIIK